MEKVNLNALEKFKVGQYEDMRGMTGVTVIVAPEGAVPGVDVRGGSPSTRDTDSLSPLANREFVHAVMLAGGSAFGLDASAGVMEVLEKNNIGRNVKYTVIPNVCGAILFDLGIGEPGIRPDKAMGREACIRALEGQAFLSGNHGAGTGATIGKRNGIKNAMKGGIGCSVLKQGELVAGAIIAVNCVGDIHENGRILAGARTDDGKSFADSEEMILEAYSVYKDYFKDGAEAGKIEEADYGNTVIGCIMTNAKLNKAQVNKLASVGHNGLARTIYPTHTVSDGDTIFALASGEVEATQDSVAILAVRAVEQAIIDAIKSADTWGDFLSLKDYEG